MGVPTGVRGIERAAFSAKLRPVPGRRIGPAGPGSGQGGKRARQIQGLNARMQKNSSISAFGVDHGAEVSKRERSTKEGAKLGAKIGGGVGLGYAAAKTPEALRAMKSAGFSRGGRAGILGATAGTGVAIDTAVGGGIGAAIGRKKRNA